MTSGGGSTLFDVDPGGNIPEVRAAGESKQFRTYDQAQQFLLPPSLDDWLGEDDEARFISEVVDDMLDLTSIFESYESARGGPPYDPRMMLKVLLYAYSTGVTSSRELERRCLRDIGFRWLSGNQAPDYRSLARFRRRHLDALPGLFTQLLSVCAEAGLVKLGRVALDGTKLQAAASKHKAMSYDRLGPKISALQAEVDALLAAAEATDLAEDVAYGEDQRGDELPKELATREGRLVKLRAAKKALEDDAAQKAAAIAREKARAKGKPPEEAEQVAEAAAENASPKGSAQRNFTDPESRIMKTNHGFLYAYNAQAVVDETRQVIVAIDLSAQATDVQQFVPMLDATLEQCDLAGVGETPAVFLADAGYCSNANLAAAERYAGEVLIATGKERSGETFPQATAALSEGASLRESMAHALRVSPGRADSARRKAIVEPVFGQMKTRQQAGRLRLRGLAGATGEWTLHTLCHNIRKLRTHLTQERAGQTPRFA